MGSLQAYEQKIEKKKNGKIIIRASFTNKVEYEK